MYLRIIFHFILTGLLFIASLSHASTINVAVASNFAHTMRLLADDFKNKTGHELIISSASTGKLYAQIINGAPFDVFLAADETRPNRLIAQQYASRDNAYTYALGKLTLLSNIKNTVDCKKILSNTNLKYLAIANPDTAPYGAAAKQVLVRMGIWKNIKSKLVMGENISQTLQFVSTKNADAGFIATSLLNSGRKITRACEWQVPQELYDPIKQKMIVLNKSKNKPVADALLKYIKSDDALSIISDSGYNVL